MPNFFVLLISAHKHLSRTRIFIRKNNARLCVCRMAGADDSVRNRSRTHSTHERNNLASVANNIFMGSRSFLSMQPRKKYAHFNIRHIHLKTFYARF